MLTATALAFLINVAGAVLNWTMQKLGRVATQVILFAVALIVAAYWQYGTTWPAIQHIIGVAVVLFSMAVAIYEVFLSYFPAFKGPKN